MPVLLPGPACQYLAQLVCSRMRACGEGEDSASIDYLVRRCQVGSTPTAVRCRKLHAMHLRTSTLQVSLGGDPLIYLESLTNQDKLTERGHGRHFRGRYCAIPYGRKRRLWGEALPSNARRQETENCLGGWLEPRGSGGHTPIRSGP